MLFQLSKLLNVLRSLLFIFSFSINIPAHALTIEEAFIKAIEIDSILKSSRFNQQAASENNEIARSRLFPQIMLQGSSNQLTQTTTQDVTGAASLSRSFTGPSINHQLMIRQGLLRHKDMSVLKLAEYQLKNSEIKYINDFSELWLRVAYAYIDLIGAQQIAETLEKPLSNMIDAAKQEKVRFEKGEGTKDSAKEAEAQYQQSSAYHAQALQSLWAKQKNFESLTKIESNQLKEIKLSLTNKSKVVLDNKTQVWLEYKENSNELRLAQLQIEMQNERLKLAKAENMPMLDVLATWNVAKNDATSTQGYRYKNNQIGIQYSMTLFAGGGISAGERQAIRNIEASMEDAVSISNKVENEFNLIWSTVLGLRARVDANNYLIDSAKELLKANALSYKYGVKTVNEVANAEALESRRIVEQINLVIEMKKNLIKLRKANLNIDNYK